MKNFKLFSLLLCMPLLILSSCSKDDGHGLTVNGRSNADVTITNETTSTVWHGDSEGIVQSTSITIGGNGDDTSFDLVAHAGDVLRVNYSPYSHFAEKHAVRMTVNFDGVEKIAVTHSPYEAKLTMENEISKDIHTLTVVGISGNQGDDCYLYERRSIRVKVE